MNQTRQQKAVGVSKRRLGEYLLSKKLVNTSQLEEAIEYQCIYGGRLGTSLIELGLVDEDQMARTLSQQLKLHYIKPDLLMNIPPSVLRLVPVKIALKYQIVPYYKDGNKLFVAINDIGNLKLQDELSFQLNHIVVPLAVPEVRLMLALKKHYGMSLSPRYETLAVQLQRRSLAGKKAAQLNQQKTFTQKQEKAVQVEETVGSDETSWPLLGEEQYDSAEPISDDYSADHTEEKQDSPVDILHLLAEAKERDDIGRAVISYLKNDFPACGLFVIREGTASGWLASGGKTDQPFDQFHIPLTQNSVCSLVARNRRLFFGQMTDTEHNRSILSYFSAQPSQNVLAVPLMVQDRLVCILYVHGALELLEQHFADLHYIVGKAEMAFKLLILKNKILSL